MKSRHRCAMVVCSPEVDDENLPLESEATGVQYSVRQFVEMAAAQLGIKLRFEGTGVEEKGIVVSVTGHDAPGVKPGDVIIAVDPRYFRPAEVETLLGDPTKAHEKLGWKPEITLREMVSEMVANDLEAAKKHSLLKSHGYDVAIARIWLSSGELIWRQNA